MAGDEIADQQTGLPERARVAVLSFAPMESGDFNLSGSPAQVLEAPRNWRITVPLILTLCLVEGGWLGALVLGVLWLFGVA